jgi:RHS repeat-associated protein
VTLPDLTATSTEHDAWGRVTRSYDPDRGITESHYNGFGDLVWTEDAASRKATFFHDALGRRVERIDEDHGASTHTTWTWDTAPLGFNPSVKAIGMLAEVASPDARNGYAYDDLGRLRTALQIVGGEPFAIKLDYDTAGRVGTIHYPAPMDGGGFAVRHDYDAYGHLVAVRDAGAPSAAYWQFTETDHAGRLHAERFGNGVETRRDYDDGKQRVKAIESTLGGARIQALSYDYDDRLNLTHRHDALQTLLPDEGFLYDDLDRLKCAYFGAAGAAFAPCSVKLEYDAAGNIKHKSDVGAADYAYSDPTHPHAVTEAGGKVYGYDAIGNQTSRPGGVTVTYTAFDLPKTITRPAGNVDLGYDGDQHRVLKSASGGDVTVYVADLYERVTHADGSREQRYYVHAGGRMVAIVTGGGATPGTRYVHTDNLGSIDVLTDEAGSVAERKSFDAFGARRNPKWHSFAAPAPSTTTRGFTGHEDEEDLGLVNMKGRIYDPKLGRFLTPDPVVSRPHDGQSWNPYSYVLNNPLAYTDPSGFDEIVAGGSYANDAGSQAGTIVQHIIGASAPAGSTPTAPAHPPTQGSAPAAPAATAAPPSGPGRPPPPPPPPPPQPDVSQALAAGAAHPPVDVSTLGSNTGHDAQPQTTSPTPSGLRFAGGVALGVATGAGKWTVEAVKGLALNVGTLGGYSVYKFWSGVYHTYKEGGVVGVVNSINPLYGIGRAGADIYLAIDKGDPVAIGQAAYTAIGVVAAVVVGARAGAPRGGTYGGVRKAWQRQGGEVHHMPSWNAQQMAGNSPFTHRSAPGIMMDVAHHRRTASWGSAGARYREAQAALLRDGRFLDALAADIANVESIAPGVYTDAMRQMAEHLWSGEW